MDFLTPKIIFEFSLRILHILAGITWIGFLYWFNLINVNFQKNLEADLKPKVNPKLIPQTLFYFRWAAVVTFITGFTYFISILSGETVSGALAPLLAWVAIVAVAYGILFFLIKPEGPMNNGALLGVVVTVVVAVMCGGIYHLFVRMGVTSNAAFSIGMGGGIGTLMLLNVWAIIWRCQKVLLGITPVDASVDKTKFARRAFLASRTNTWLSLPMLFFMGASTHLQIFARWY